MTDTKTPVCLYDIVIRHYVSKDSYREALLYPYVDDGNMIASNAYHVIIIPTKYIQETPDIVAVGYPNYQKAIPAHDPQIELFTFSALALKDALAPFEKHAVYTECERCEGSGTIGCEECGSDVDCRWCKGSGDSEDISHMEYSNSEGLCKIGLAVFSLNWISAMQEVANALGVDEIKCMANAANNGSLFYINDVRIVIMPIAHSGGIHTPEGDSPILTVIPILVS